MTPNQNGMTDAGDLVQPGKYLVLRNAKVEMIKARMRLAVDKFGKISVPEQAYDFEVKVRSIRL